MRKLFYLGFCLVLATGVGCALTDYELICDHDQGNGSTNGDPRCQGTSAQFPYDQGTVVNTNGKAHIIEGVGVQVSTTWPDGTDETLWFVDQKANGDRTLTTYNNFTSGCSGLNCAFHMDFYCNPDWNGCATVSANDPDTGDVDPYDYSGNSNCSGYRSLAYLTATTRFYGECGRAALNLADRLSFLNMGEPTDLGGVAGLRWVASPMNTSVFMDNLAGTRVNIPLTGTVTMTMTGNGRPTGNVDFTNPSLKVMNDYIANFYENYGSSVNHVDVVYNGLTWSKSFGVVDGIAKKVRNRSNERF